MMQRFFNTAALGCMMMSLTACGGFTAVDVGGTVTGLTGTGLQIANGDEVISINAGATTFVFPNQVGIRSPYLITVVTQPARQTCEVANGKGTAGAAPVTVVNVTCTANTYPLSGKVTGLTGANLILTNGSDRITIPNGAADGSASFTFPTPVADGAAYGVAVLAQPFSQTCTVQNGTAVMSGPVDSVLVNCI